MTVNLVVGFIYKINIYKHIKLMKCLYIEYIVTWPTKIK